MSHLTPWSRHLTQNPNFLEPVELPPPRRTGAHQEATAGPAAACEAGETGAGPTATTAPQRPTLIWRRSPPGHAEVHRHASQHEQHHFEACGIEAHQARCPADAGAADCGLRDRSLDKAVGDSKIGPARHRGKSWLACGLCTPAWSGWRCKPHGPALTAVTSLNVVQHPHETRSPNLPPPAFGATPLPSSPTTPSLHHSITPLPAMRFLHLLRH